ncbi:MAG: nucleotidyl transferase AbiEii/AbiGii toxin family protein [Ardenticatenia bacterium]|nr:nucleotidyl transferase AbiEii/AbiGii toxin family protein [Ardenticatenia bacterium]
MQVLDYWKAVTVDRSDLLERLIGLLDVHGVHYCVIGGQGVNAYVDPLVSLDLDLAVATVDLPRVRALLADAFKIEVFPHSVNVSAPDSALRVQFQTDERYAQFVDRASRRMVLGMDLPVARVEDLLDGKVWAAMDPSRRPSKRQKDLADIARLIEAYPHLRAALPPEILARLL